MRTRLGRDAGNARDGKDDRGIAAEEGAGTQADSHNAGETKCAGAPLFVWRVEHGSRAVPDRLNSRQSAWFP
jgi:hypothetical protein